MKALSIRQPWAWLIVNGYKDIENRTWRSSFRGSIYVHTGQKLLTDDFQVQRDYIEKLGLVLPDSFNLGAIIGEITITDCIDTSVNPWFCGPFGFVLSDPIAYPEPISCKGRLGLLGIPFLG